MPNRVINKEYLALQFKKFNETVFGDYKQTLIDDINAKVDIREGYDLSKNDFDDAFKAKLEGLENYNDTQIKADIAANTAAITKLNGDVETEGSVANTIENRVTELVNNAPEDFDTLKEIADWIDTHGTAATQMNKEIGDNAAAIEALQSAQDNMNYEFETENIDFATLEASAPVEG